MQNKKEIVSIIRIVLNIRRINNGLISFIGLVRKFQVTNINSFTNVVVDLLKRNKPILSGIIKVHGKVILKFYI